MKHLKTLALCLLLVLSLATEAMAAEIPEQPESVSTCF